MEALMIFEIATLLLVCVYLIAKLKHFSSYDIKLKKINLLKEFKKLSDNKIIEDKDLENLKKDILE